MAVDEIDDRPEPVTVEELSELWPLLSREDRTEGFFLLPREESEEFFLSLSSADQAHLLLAIAPVQRRSWIRLLPPDDAADLLQCIEGPEREALPALLDDQTRHEVNALLAYREDEAGGLMSPRFARARPDMTVDEALTYLRRQSRESPLETIYLAYVLDKEQRLLGVVSLRDLFNAQPTQRVQEIMERDVVTVSESMDQEGVSRIFSEHDLIALPVVDDEGRMKGIVTVDDIVDVVQEEATEDIHKAGGMSALEAPYLRVGIFELIKKRGGWLAVLFLGEMLTATAMAFYENAIAKAVVLAMFIPLIISSGGNSGSQASTLIIRAMALGEVRLRDWFLVMRRELAAGLGLGVLLATIGAARIILWQVVANTYGEHYLLVAATVAVSLLGVVLFGTLAGSMLPFLLRRLGLDPASASAPFVATMVDVTGLVIYFSAASLIMAKVLAGA